MFDYILTSTQSEREELLHKVRDIVREAQADNREAYAEARRNRKSQKARAAYLETCQRLGAFSDLLELLGMYSEVYDDIGNAKE